MKLIARFIVLSVFTTALSVVLQAQMTPEPKSDVSNKALITKETPPVKPASARTDSANVAALRKMADEYYSWRNENYPVGSSDAGTPHLG